MNKEISKKENWGDVVKGVKDNTLEIYVLSNYGIKFLDKTEKQVLNSVQRHMIGRNWLFLLIANLMAFGGLIFIFWIPWYAGIIITIIGFNWGMKLVKEKEWYEKKHIKIVALQNKKYYDLLIKNKAILIVEK